MGISIKNEEVEEMIRQLTEQTGESITAAVREAVRDRLDRIKGETEADREARRIRLREAVARFRALPVNDPRHPDDILYDDAGLPR